MEMQIHAFAQCVGVSVRTLHYYDEIGLLKPTRVDPQSGYRFYDAHSLARMQEILFFRELDFPLKEIRAILSAPDYDKSAALRAQKQLLTLKKARLERLIAALDAAVEGNEISMNVFDNQAYESQRTAYAQEAAARWGDTAAYRKFTQKQPSYSDQALLDRCMADFAQCRAAGHTPDSPAAQQCVRALQQCITDHYYTCTAKILAGLGEMYAADARFTANIDAHGAGTAAFIRDAIRAFCK